MNTPTTTFAPFTCMRASFDRFAGPQSTLCSVILLIVRVYLSYVFFRSSPTKLNNWDMTVSLFTEEYKMPLLPLVLVAALGTLGEPVFPSLMLAGVAPWLVVAGLFFTNVVATMSYWVNLLASAVEFRLMWGVLIALVATVGPGWLAAQTLWQRRRR